MQHSRCSTVDAGCCLAVDAAAAVGAPPLQPDCVSDCVPAGLPASPGPPVHSLGGMCLHYPVYLHNLHGDYLLAPATKEIDEEVTLTPHSTSTNTSHPTPPHAITSPTAEGEACPAWAPTFSRPPPC